MWYNYVLEIDVNAACNLPQAYFDGLVGKAGGVPVGDGTDFVAVDGVQIARTYAWEWCILGNGNNRAKLETQIHGAQIALASIPGVSVVLHRLTENL